MQFFAFFELSVVSSPEKYFTTDTVSKIRTKKNMRHDQRNHDGLQDGNLLILMHEIGLRHLRLFWLFTLHLAWWLLHIVFRSSLIRSNSWSLRSSKEREIFSLNSLIWKNGDSIRFITLTDFASLTKKIARKSCFLMKTREEIKIPTRAGCVCVCVYWRNRLTIQLMFSIVYGIVIDSIMIFH